MRDGVQVHKAEPTESVQIGKRRVPWQSDGTDQLVASAIKHRYRPTTGASAAHEYLIGGWVDDDAIARMAHRQLGDDLVGSGVDDMHLVVGRVLHVDV